MIAQVKSSFHISLEKVPRIASIVVFLVGCIVLAGWQFGLPALTSLLPGSATMKANSALGFILCAISLWLLAFEQTKGQARLLANACAIIVLLIAILTLGEYISNRDFGFDQLLFRDNTLATGTSFPGRMSPATALNFLLLACSLLLIDNRWSSWLNQSLTIAALVIASMAVIGYIYSVSSLYQIGVYASMALHTALTFILLCLGILSARPEHGLINIFMDEGAAGILARRLLPAAIAIPSALGLLGLTGQRLGLYDTAFGTALFAMSNVIVFSALIVWNTHMLHRAGIERVQAEKALSLTQQRARALTENSWDAIALFGTDGTILYGSASTPQILGYSLVEFVGRNAFELIHEEDQALVTERLTLSLQQPGAHVPVYARVRHKNGEWRWLEGVFTNMLDEPSVRAIVNNYHDFTDRKRDEDALHTSESRNTAIIESSLDALITIDYLGRILEFNPAAQEIFGYTLSEAVGKEMAELIIPPSLREQHRRGLAQYLSTGEAKVLGKRIEITGMRADGTEFPVELTINRIKGEEPPVFTGFIRDISGRKLTEEILVASEERFRLVVEAAPSAMIAVDHAGKINLVNAKAQELFGYPPEELVGRPVEMLVPERFRSGHPNYRQNFLAQPTNRPMGAGRDLFGLHKDGREIPIEIGLTPYESSESQFTIALIVDITERKRAEQSLKASEERFRLIVEAAPSAIIAVDAAGKINLVNAKAQELFGYSSEELLGRSVDILVPERFRTKHPDYRQGFVAKPSRRSMGAGRDLFGLHKDGHEVPIEIGLTPYESSEGQFTLALIVDITERSQAEEKIAYQAYLLENVNDAVIGSDENSYIRFWNQGAERMFGWKAEEVLGRSGREILRSEFIDTDRETVLKILSEQGRWKGESIFYHKDGSQVIMEVSSITLRDANGLITGYVSVNRDITERKQAEEYLQANAARAVLIAELSQAFAQLTNDYQGLLGLAVRRIAELIGDYCAIRLVEADDVTLQLVVDHHLDPSAQEFMHRFISSITQRMDEGITAQVFRSGKAVLLPFVSPDAFRAQVKPEFHPLLERLNIHSVLIAPLRAEGKIIGTITMSRDQTPHAYTEEDRVFLQDLADRAALAIVSARLYTAMQQLNAKLEQRVVERTEALSQANALLQMLLDYMPDHIYFKDAQSRFIRNSRSQAKSLGLSDPAEAVGKSDFDFFPHAQLSYEKEQEIMQSGKPLMDLEERVVWPDGRETWVSTTKMPLLDQDGQVIGTFGISRDITERKRAEAALQKAKLELESANKELEAFSYSVSHDLRSPLRSIDGFSQALLEDYGELLPPEGRNFLERVRSSAQRMAELIDDLLNLSKVTRASMKLVPVDLSQIAEGIAAELERNHSEHHVRLTIAKNLKAHGDPNLLRIVLENLINNAWKFTSKQPQAEIEFGSKHENGETVYFIRDNGAGFDMAYAGKLFGAFQRLHSMTEFSGTGIGLATVQRIIHRHGGRVWAEGAVDQGATFFFTLPALGRVKPTDKLERKEKDSLIKRMEEII
jgi:PAS domain S-box-containing protein